MNLIELMEKNSVVDGRLQVSGRSTVFDSQHAAVKIVKKGFVKARKAGAPIANMDFSVGQFVYLAQPITGLTRPNEWHWANKMKREVVRLNANALTSYQYVTVIDPWDLNVSALFGVDIGALEPCVDYAIVNHAKAVFVDFTRGISVGATAEMLCANDRGTPVIGVAKPLQRLSVFTRRHVDSWWTPQELRYTLDPKNVGHNVNADHWLQSILASIEEKA